MTFREVVAGLRCGLLRCVRHALVKESEHRSVSSPLTWDCHDCGAPEGYLHLPGCDMEECPICGGQLITCEHFGEVFGEDGAVMVKRIPYILYPNICARCGKPWPVMFHVPTEEWERYIAPSQRGKILCSDCYLEIVALIEGRSNTHRGPE